MEKGKEQGCIIGGCGCEDLSSEKRKRKGRTRRRGGEENKDCMERS